MKKYLLVIILVLSSMSYTYAQNVANDNMTSVNNPKMEWWKNAKFGMFIHWGVYSVPAGTWEGKTSYGEWFMNETKMSRAQYSAFANEFNPTKFNAEEWVQLAKAAGQKYIVITSKHHDGFAMFKSNASKYNIYDATPFHRDVIAELAAACRKYGMKLGLYYSQAQDWYHPGGGMYCKEWDETHKGDMDKYLDEVAIPQVKEILSNYGDIAILWWDTPANITPERAKKLHDITKQYPNLITNNRLGGNVGGDLETPEQFIPATGFPGRNWEVCMTMNGHWGYNAYDDEWKSIQELIRKLVDIVSKGGNFLLNVGPNKYGEIPKVCQGELKDMGEWLNMNGEAVYGTQASPFPYLPFGRATKKGSKLYLHIFDWSRQIAVPSALKFKRAYLLADKNTNLEHFVKDGYTYFKLPAYAPDKIASVMAVECEQPIATQEVASKGAKITSDGDVTALSDNDPHSKWEAASNRATILIELKKVSSIQCLAFVEPWHPWDHKSQKYTLEAFKNNQWTKVAEGASNGTGVTVPFKLMKAQKFKLTVENASGKVNLNEVILYN